MGTISKPMSSTAVAVAGIPVPCLSMRCEAQEQDDDSHEEERPPRGSHVLTEERSRVEHKDDHDREHHSEVGECVCREVGGNARPGLARAFS